MPCNPSPTRVAAQLAYAAGATFSSDIVVRDPQDAARRYMEWDPLIREAVDHGEVLYQEEPRNQTVREWLDKARGDLRTARRERDAEDYPSHDAACFHAQQAAEKYIKAMLIHHRVTADRTQDLGVWAATLTEKVGVTLTADPEALAELTQAAVAYRYPGHAADAQAAARAIAVAERVEADVNATELC